MNAQPEQKNLLGKVLRIEGVAFFLIGVVLATKPYYSEIIFFDSELDFKIGCTLIFFGFINIFIANKFFKRETK